MFLHCTCFRGMQQNSTIYGELQRFGGFTGPFFFLGRKFVVLLHALYLPTWNLVVNKGFRDQQLKMYVDVPIPRLVNSKMLLIETIWKNIARNANTFQFHSLFSGYQMPLCHKSKCIELCELSKFVQILVRSCFLITLKWLNEWQGHLLICSGQLNSETEYESIKVDTFVFSCSSRLQVLSSWSTSTQTG